MSKLFSFIIIIKEFIILIYRLETVQISWRSVDEAIKRASKLITDHERFLGEVKRTSGDGLQGIRSEYKSLEV